MSRAPTNPSTRRLSEVARLLILPKGIATTGYPSVRQKIAAMGVPFDEWQHGLGTCILAKRADGKYAATVGGVVISIPRQVGKTYTIGAILFALCILFPGTTVLWTAHHTKTSGETFRSMQGMARRRKVAPHVLQVLRGSGKEAILFRNGSRILFGAREQGFGRGIPNVDVIVFDEAQILTSKALDDMVASTNQTKHPHGALIFYLGTPPRPEDPGAAFAGKRAKSIAGKAPKQLYVEMSGDPGYQPTPQPDPMSKADWAQVARANASFPHHTPPESIERLRENLPDVESFIREGLGIWPEDDDSGTYFSPGKWLAGIDPEKASSIVGDLALGLELSLDRKRAWICAAGYNDDGAVHLEPIWTGPVAQAVEQLSRKARRHKAVGVALDAGGPAADLVPKLRRSTIKRLVLAMDTEMVKVASSEIFDLVEAVGHAHLDDADLNAAVKAAVQKPVGDRFVIGMRSARSDVAPFKAAAVAAWALAHPPKPQTPFAGYA